MSKWTDVRDNIVDALNVDVVAVTCAMPLFLCDFPPDPDCKKVL